MREPTGSRIKANGDIRASPCAIPGFRVSP
jgi:hypothetical protein